MRNPSLQAPDHPIALRRSHLLAPAPDRLTNTPTTLRITRENTVSGRDFSVHQLRSHEELSSPRRHALLFTVSGRFWSNSQLREIRDASGRPLLELRRLWWKGQWSVRRAGGRGEDLLLAEMRWGIGMKMGVRFENALLRGAWDREEIAEMNRNRNRSHSRSLSLGSPYSRRGELRQLSASRARQQPQPDPVPGGGGNSNLPSYEHAHHSARGSPPPYDIVMAEDHAQQSSSGSGGGGGSGGSGTESDDSMSDDDEKAGMPDCPLPSYDSVRRMRRFSSHSLRDLLDAIEPPGEPAPASSSSLSSPRPRSEGAINTKVELKLVQQSSTFAAVMMGDKRIIHVRREKVMDYNMSGPVPRWEVEVAEGVDLLLATSIVLILAESVKHEYRVRTN
ncbi:hypothetical protein N7486_010317 [Penicillium sp. IBT 16267x]|nr:hypothetical protein N7486_010317 [Penicillium sp. IBT 16267x]